MASELETLSSIEAHGDLNPIQRTRLNDLRSQQPQQSNPIQGAVASLSPDSVLKNAQQVNDYYKQQNQPVIQSYQASKAPLEQRYKDLLTSIKGNQQIAENRQTTVTNNELGRRGITGDSSLAGQEITNAVNPITQQYTGMLKDTTNQQNIDLSAIDKAIAQLNAGNPESSVSTAMGIGSAEQAAQQFAQSLAQQQAQQQQQYELANQNYGLQTQQLAQQIAQQNAANAIAKQNSGIAGGHLALDQAQFDYTKSLNDPANIQKLFSQLGFGNGMQSTNQSRYSIVP